MVTPTSVVICTYSEARWDQLVAAVCSVREQTAPADELIVVVDNNAALYERVRRAFPDLVTVPNGGQPGLSGARNSGIAAARGEVIAFLDDDAVAEPDWLACLSEPYDHESVLGVGGAIEPAWEQSDAGWFPAEFNWVVGCSYAGLPAQRAPVRNFIGCNMSFRAEVLRALDGFRHEIGRVGARPLAGEETELCIRLRQRWPGSLLIHEPRARVRHHVPAVRTTWRYFRQRCYAEGLSKARVTRFVGARDGLASERRHAFTVLPVATLRALSHGVRHGEPAAFARAGAIVAGLTFTTAGYVTGSAAERLARHPSPDRRGTVSLPSAVAASREERL
ncbi:MAG TPA: glycosyltransferase [Dehalococcoidia bacterium]|jgi:glycosyltransferase involved in cell wall biosynthesis